MTTEFRIMRESSEFDFPFSVIQRVWDELNTPNEPDPRLAELTPGQRAAYSLQWIFAEVCNGGFDQCFSNSTGYLLPEVIDGAQLFEAPQWMEVLAAARNTLGQPYPRDRDERNRRLDSLSSDEQATLDECDSRLYALDATADTSLTALTVRYINANPDESSSIPPMSPQPLEPSSTPRGEPSTRRSDEILIWPSASWAKR